MKMIKGIFIILLFYFLGQGISYLIQGFVPGNIIGMVLLFLSLYFKAISPDNVKDVANVFTRNMAIFFIPAGAGLLGAYGVISKFWMSILIVCSVSTVLVIVVVAIVQQQMERRRKWEHCLNPQNLRFSLFLAVTCSGNGFLRRHASLCCILWLLPLLLL